MSNADQEVTLKIGGDSTEAQRALEETIDSIHGTTRAADKLETQAEKTGISLKDMAAGAAMGAAGFYAAKQAVDFLWESTERYFRSAEDGEEMWEALEKQAWELKGKLFELVIGTDDTTLAMERMTAILSGTIDVADWLVGAAGDVTHALGTITLVGPLVSAAFGLMTDAMITTREEADLTAASVEAAAEEIAGIVESYASRSAEFQLRAAEGTERRLAEAAARSSLASMGMDVSDLEANVEGLTDVLLGNADSWDLVHRAESSAGRGVATTTGVIVDAESAMQGLGEQGLLMSEALGVATSESLRARAGIEDLNTEAGNVSAGARGIDDLAGAMERLSSVLKSKSEEEGHAQQDAYEQIMETVRAKAEERQALEAELAQGRIDSILIYKDAEREAELDLQAAMEASRTEAHQHAQQLAAEREAEEMARLQRITAGIMQASGSLTSALTGAMEGASAEDLFGDIIGDASNMIGDFAIKSGAALVLLNPAIGAAEIAAGVALKAFGASLGAGGSRDAGAAPPASAGSAGNTYQSTTQISVSGFVGDRSDMQRYLTEMVATGQDRGY